MDFIALQTALAGQYFLEREVGRGGMGVVYLAREVRLDRPVAIKVLPPALAARPELRERFMREARTAAKLSHPNVVAVHRVDEAGDFVYLTMAYVDGGTLGDRLRARGTVPAAEVRRLVREVGWALAYAHARGVVHRDVKPDNILLDAETGRALVTDFGIAQLADGAAITGEGLVMGTAHYMSPEQAAGEPLDGRSDLYSLGVVGYQALAGRPPFDAPTVPALLAKHLTQEPPPLVDVPPRLARVIRQCLAKLPDERPATGEVLADLVDEAAVDERQLPAPLRAFADARDPLMPVYALWSGGMALMGVMSVLVRVTGRMPLGESRVTNVLLYAALPVIPFTVFQLRQTYRALAYGYTVDDLRRALTDALRRRREEIAASTSMFPAWFERGMRALTYGSMAMSLGFLLSLPWVRTELQDRIPNAIPATLFFGSIALGIAGSAMGITFPGRTSDHGILDRLRLRVLNSRTGERFTKLLGHRARDRAPNQLVYRPTELAIGLAADQLFDALPRAAKRDLRDLPAIIRGLEREADSARRRADALSASLDDMADDTSSRLAEQRRDVGDELREARDLACQRRDAAVTALETIRLDLLRLQAHPDETRSLTAVLTAARRLEANVDALVATRPAAPSAIRLPSPPHGITV